MSVTRQSFARSLLQALNLPTTNSNLQIIVGWTLAEGGAGPQFGTPNNTANFNPLNTTLALPGSTSANSAGVQSYASWTQGLDATSQTLAQPNMSSIVAMLQSGTAAAAAAAAAVDTSPWGTKDLTAALITGANVSANDTGTPIAGPLSPGSNPTSASLWYVGDEMNPDEDYWTCINRYGTSAQWYVFSDGEALYAADGIQLMGQTPTDVIVLFDERVIEANLTFDNCLMLDTPIPTPDGWTTMGAVQVGDLVLGSDGRPTRVVGVSEVHRDHDCFRLTFGDGTSIVADDGHLWETISTRRVGYTIEAVAHQRYRGIRTTAEIAATLCDSAGHAAHLIKLAKPFDLPARALPVDPYVMGYWLGDGTTGTPIITVSEEDCDSLVSEVERAGYEHNTRSGSSTGFSQRRYWRVSPRTPGGFSGRLREAGVLARKHIPEAYLRASFAQRLALLQGLMDSDGTIGSHCELTLADERLAREALELMRTLGFAPNWSERPARGTSRRQFALNFATKPHLNVFRLPRKADRYNARLAAKTNGGRTCRAIRSVESVPTVPVRCIQVDAEDHLYLAGEGMVATHNTTFQYTHTSVKKGNVVRKAVLARTTSPTECEIKILCPIDAYRGGDVVILKAFGQAADGPWLVGECRRSIFDPFSTLTLVQGMAPINAVSGLPFGPAFLAGKSATAPGSGSVINAMVSEAASINNEHLPYVWGGGHASAGTPSGSPIPGFDCSGAVAAVLAAGGLWKAGASVPTDAGVFDQLVTNGSLLPGQGPGGSPECVLFDNPGVHIYARINGKYWGTWAGGSDTPGGGGWCPSGYPMPGFRAGHVPVSLLGQQPSPTGG